MCVSPLSEQELKAKAGSSNCTALPLVEILDRILQNPVGSCKILHRNKSSYAGSCWAPAQEQDLVQDPFRILDRTGSCQEKTWSVIPFRILTGSCQDPMSNQDPEGIDRILLRILSGSCQDPSLKILLGSC